MTTMIRRMRRQPPNPDGRMSVMDHLRELRRRLILAVIFIALGAVVGWVLYDPVLRFLEHPYCSVPAKHRYSPDGKSCDLIYTGVLDGFTTRLKVAFIAGTVFTAPLWLYQVWAFVTPGLHKNERKYTVSFIAASTVLFAAGMSLAYVVLSKGLNVLLGSSGAGTQALLTVNNYLGFVTLMLLVFGAAFEVPLVVVMANMAGVVSAKILKKSQRLAIFLIFVFAAVATPSTDPFTMCAMAIPMVVLFEGAVLFAIVHDRRKAARQAQERLVEHLDDDQPSAVDALAQPLSASDSWLDTT
ncbi:MAG: twin-arginine translocase subunit TatC [Actinomycetota bacterium]|nr:twin-arginine translocase subunit TatC [Actinomycetota bacterium]